MSLFQKPNEKTGLMKGVFMAHFVLLLHLLLLAGLCAMALLLSGMVNYMFAILLTGAGVLAYSGYKFNRRIKEEKEDLVEMMGLPMFSGRSVEVSFMGGFASIKIGNPNENNLPLIPQFTESPLQIGYPGQNRVRDLTELANLYEKNLITLEEYNNAKHQILNP